MKLETAQGIASDSVSEAELIDAFQDDARRGEFIVLSQSKEVYIQAGGEQDGPYSLEYRDGNKDRHFRCNRDVSKSEVQAVFLKYLRGESSWQSQFEWEKLETRPWWKLW
jgi:hypothetical protein